MAQVTTNEKLGFALSAAVDYTSSDLATKCRQRAKRFEIVSQKIAAAAELFDLAEFSAGIEMLQEASNALD